MRILNNSSKQKQLVVKKSTNIYTILKVYEPKIGDYESLIENRQPTTDNQKRMERRKRIKIRKRKENPDSNSKNVKENLPNNKPKMSNRELNLMRFKNCQKKHFPSRIGVAGVLLREGLK